MSHDHSNRIAQGPVLAQTHLPAHRSTLLEERTNIGVTSSSCGVYKSLVLTTSHVRISLLWEGFERQYRGDGDLSSVQKLSSVGSLMCDHRDCSSHACQVLLILVRTLRGAEHGHDRGLWPLW